MSQSQKVLVAGTGLSGIAAAKLLLEIGGEVVLYDSNIELDAEELKNSFLLAARVTVVLGELNQSDLMGIELCIISPGIPLDAPFVAVVDEMGIPVWSEIQLAYQCTKGKLAAITGTNGKTTTTALAGEIAKNHFSSVFVVGNIGLPFTACALKTKADSVTIAEVSSFQLETIMDFRPNVSAILNIAPDHLNRHKTMENYIKIKESITRNQTEEDSCILNYDDEVLREFGQSLKTKVIYFSSTKRLESGFFLEEDMIIFKEGEKETQVANVHELKLLGRHNYENVMAAAAIGLELGIPMESIQKTIKEFKAVEHRIEFVLERAGVKYYNDSKGTNPDAAIQAVKAMPGPTLLIAGGYDKNSEYDQWIQSFGSKVKYLVLLGQTRDKIAECAKKHGFTEIMYAEDMAEAVRVCASYANMGDNVLLSPACASWGMYKNYEERGDVFKQSVRNL